MILVGSFQLRIFHDSKKSTYIIFSQKNVLKCSVSPPHKLSGHTHKHTCTDLGKTINRTLNSHVYMGTSVCSSEAAKQRELLSADVCTSTWIGNNEDTAEAVKEQFLQSKFTQHLEKWITQHWTNWKQSQPLLLPNGHDTIWKPPVKHTQGLAEFLGFAAYFFQKKRDLQTCAPGGHHMQ